MWTTFGGERTVLYFELYIMLRGEFSLLSIAIYRPTMTSTGKTSKFIWKSWHQLAYNFMCVFLLCLILIFITVMSCIIWPLNGFTLNSADTWFYHFFHTFDMDHSTNFGDVVIWLHRLFLFYLFDLFVLSPLTMFRQFHMSVCVCVHNIIMFIFIYKQYHEC